MAAIKRIIGGAALTQCAAKWGCRVYIDHNFETGLIRIGVIRPDGGKNVYAFKRYTEKRLKEIVAFMLPY
jgi:hypothetical protein